MLRFYEALDSVVSLYYPMKRLSGGRLASLNTAEAAYIAMYPPAVLSRLESLLRSAEQLADDERSRKWIGLTRISFDYVRLTATAYTLYRAYQASPNRAARLQLQDAVEKWCAHRDRILNLDKESIAEWFPGHASWVDFFKTKGHLDSVIRAPFDWDFEKMLARYAAGTPQGPPLLRVARAPKPPVLDGIIHEEEWKHAAPAEVGLMGGGPAPVETSVRETYDDRCLYVAFTCAEPQIQAMRRTGQKRDGALWNLDCVELFLDPEGMGTKFLHFIAVPDDDARYDARRGYIEDPVHPLYDREDVSWNAEWRHTYVVDEANKRWSVRWSSPCQPWDSPACSWHALEGQLWPRAVCGPEGGQRSGALPVVAQRAGHRLLRAALLRGDPLRGGRRALSKETPGGPDGWPGVPGEERPRVKGCCSMV